MRVFLGYASEHLEVARRVLEILRKDGDFVWFDKESLIGGDRWDVERHVAQREAHLVVHLCSIEIIQRPGVVNREIRDSLDIDRDRPFGTTYFVPVKIGEFDMPRELEDKQWIHLADPKFAEKLGSSLDKRRRQLPIEEDVRIKEVESKPPAVIESPDQVLRMPLSSGSHRVEFEDICEEFECRGEYLRFDGTGLYWEFVNGVIASLALEGYFANRSEFLNWEVKFERSPETKSVWSISAEEFYRSGDLLSIRFYEYSYFEGAAHPNHGIKTLNFGGKHIGKVDIERLLGRSEKGARAILDYCEKIVVAGLNKDDLPEHTFFDGYRDDIENIWKLLSKFNFDRRGVTFNFSPYDVLPYVYGIHESFVPWGVFFEYAEYFSETEEETIKKMSTAP